MLAVPKPQWLLGRTLSSMRLNLSQPRYKQSPWWLTCRGMHKRGMPYLFMHPPAWTMDVKLGVPSARINWLTTTLKITWCFFFLWSRQMIFVTLNKSFPASTEGSKWLLGYPLTPGYTACCIRVWLQSVQQLLDNINQIGIPRCFTCEQLCSDFQDIWGLFIYLFIYLFK